MRKSRHVAAPLLAAAAIAMMSGCHKPEMQRCVDENNRVVDDSLCANQPPGAQNQNPNGTGYFPNIYRYYYGGWGGYDRGTMVGGGSYAPVSGHSYADSSGHGTVRGGFGSSMSDSGGHDSSAQGSGRGGGAGS
ncbi:hypothetical protein [Edaphobacter bradus]|uniref:hypothetical protein n=1 Tax=Edaphobacter bradus TaxID=2259016 RepID=UPI0021DF6E0A|nr:hypothetical protein [Edaphobacter bradus]